MAEVVAETAHEVYYLQRRHLAVLLPQTCRETCHDGTGEGGSHHRRQCAALREYVRRTALRHHVGLHPAVGRGSHAAERGVAALRSDGSHTQHITGVGREPDLLPWVLTIVAGTVHQHHAAARHRRRHTRDECRPAASRSNSW